jgi:hypothetical protein
VARECAHTVLLSDRFRVRRRLVSLMRHSLHPDPLHLCDDCNRPFVVPVSIVDLVDGDRAVVELHCTNCGRTVLGVHDDASLEALDVELSATTESIREALAVLEYVEEAERIEAFADALRRDLILPEDF